MQRIITIMADCYYIYGGVGLLHLWLIFITFMVESVIAFVVKCYYIYGGYYIYGWFFITFMVGITFMVVITFMGDTAVTLAPCPSTVGR